MLAGLSSISSTVADSLCIYDAGVDADRILGLFTFGDKVEGPEVGGFRC